MLVELKWVVVTASNSTITAYGARIVDHDDKSKESNHVENAPTTMDLSAVTPACPGLSDVALRPGQALRSLAVGNRRTFSGNTRLIRANATSCGRFSKTK